MTRKLREELHRIGDTAPVVTVPHDTWTRARRARSRDRITIVAACIALVAVAGGLAMLLPGALPRLTPADPPSRGGVPDRIWPVPAELVQLTENVGNEATWDDRVAEPKLDVGRASAAFTAGEYGVLPVVITAADGAYRPLDLPGFVDAAGLNSGGRSAGALALSPDGRRLAYGWWDPAAQLDKPMPAGIRIVDLESGDIRTVALHGGNGVEVDGLTWSGDGRWLLWWGVRTLSWTPGSKGGNTPVAGRVPLDTLRSDDVPHPRNSAPGILAISTSGEVATGDDTEVRLWSGPGGRPGPVAEAASIGLTSGRFSPDDRLLIGGRDSLHLVDFAKAQAQQLVVPEDPNVAAEARPLGWIDEQSAVVLTQTPEPDSGRLVLLRFTQDGDYEQRVIGTVDAEPFNSLTIAVDLMDPDRPTVPMPEPAWPWSIQRTVATALLSAAVLLLAAYLFRRYFRARRLR